MKPKLAPNRGPQNITVHSESVAVLLTRRDYLKLIQPKPGFAELLRTSTLIGSDLTNKLAPDYKSGLDPVFWALNIRLS
jgi:hypothetical protein